MLIAKIRDAVFKLGQQQLLAGIEHLMPVQLEAFLSQLEKYDVRLCLQQKKLLHSSSHTALSNAAAFTGFEKSGNEADHRAGASILREGKVGCLILAGGQGTRLGFTGPKGSIGVSPIKEKSLFQIFCERTKAASAWAGRDLPLCIMTSPLNHAQTIAFFESHNYFGLSSGQISFFKQEMLPFIDDRGNWLLEEPGKVAEGPDGNGHALRLFFESGLWDLWKAQGVEFLNVIVVDNVLADPFDPELIGFIQRTKVDVCLKAVERLSENEKMGVIGKQNGRLKLIEYSELPAGNTQFILSNIGLFCITMDFIRVLYQDLKIEMPLHLARKSARVLLGAAHGHFQEDVYVWKCERFIFDIFDYVRKSAVLVYPREKVYAPLKNATGDKSIETVRKALFSHYRDIYQAVTGLLPPVVEFELDPVFYFPSDDLKRKLIDHPISSRDYITFTS